MFDLNHRFFRPLWIRIALTAFLLAWAVYEFSTGAWFWGLLFAGAGTACAHGFFMGSAPSGGDDEKGK